MNPELLKKLKSLFVPADATATPAPPRQMTIGPRTGTRTPLPEPGMLAAIQRSAEPSPDTPMGWLNEMFNPIRAGAQARELGGKAAAAMRRGEAGKAAGLGALAAMAVPGVPGPDDAVRGESVLKRTIRELSDPYLKARGQLEDYISGPLYREANIESALTMMPTRFGSQSDLIFDRPYFANAPEYAIGQGNNRGVLMEFSPAGLRGQLAKEKPTWETSYNSGYAEFRGMHNPQKAYQDALQSVTIKRDAKTDRVSSRLMKSAIKDLEERGWKREVLEDGSIKLRKPQEPLLP